MTILRVIEGGAMSLTSLEQLAKDIHNDLTHEASNRETWVEIKLNLCQHLFEARETFQSDKAFGEWLDENNLGKDRLNHNDRAAAVRMGADLERLRGVLTKTKSACLQLIHKHEWHAPQFTNDSKPWSKTPTEPPPTKSLGVSAEVVERVRAVRERCPDASSRQIATELGISRSMAWRAGGALGVDYGNSRKKPSSPRSTPSLTRAELRERKHQGMVRTINSHLMPKLLTRQEVDPEFEGSNADFVGAYGLTLTMTAVEYASMWFRGLAGDMKSIAKYFSQLPARSRDVGLDKLREPSAADVAKLEEAMAFLRPKMAEAEAALARAHEALAARSSKASMS